MPSPSYRIVHLKGEKQSVSALPSIKADESGHGVKRIFGFPKFRFQGATNAEDQVLTS
jgi:hypothetical protein